MRWHTADFHALSWQGIHVHGWRIIERAPGVADLALDIDWVLAWPQPDDGDPGHVVAQAMLVFHDVAGLRFVLDYAACSAASGPFSINTLHREPLERDAAGDGGPRSGLPGDDGPEDEWPEDAGIAEDYGPWRWRIDLAWPEGEWVFEASGFSQWLVGEPHRLDEPVLPMALRS